MDNAADVILIYPKTGMDFGSTVAPPYSLLTIAAPLHKAGYKVKIIDQRVDKNWKSCLIDKLQAKPICVGISSMTGSQIFFALEAAKIVRSQTNGKVPIVWGGPHPSILPRQTLESEYVDIVCIGEGDNVFLELVNALGSRTSLSAINGIAFKDGSQIITTAHSSLIDIEDLLPVPWELLNVENYIHSDMYLQKSGRTLDIGQTSRGCPFNCGFCCSASLRMRKWRAMSVQRSLEAIVQPVRRFKLNGIWIRDDEFYIDRERASKICEGIIKQNLNIHWYTSGTRADILNRASAEEMFLLKRSGAYVLKIGAESGSDRVLKLMNKGITVGDIIQANLKTRKHGIIPTFALMIGFPTETFEEMNKTIDLTFRLRRDNPMAHFETMAIYTALPGTPMYELALQHGLKPPNRLEEWIDWNFDEYDLKGKRIPWFNYQEREKIGNISYMSVLANAIPNLLNSVENIFIRWLLRIVYAPIAYFYQLRLKLKRYTFSADLSIIRYLRTRILYRSYLILK